MFENYPERVLKFRKIIVVFVIIATLVLGFGIKFLKINSDITSYLKPDDPVMVLFNRIGKEYGGNLMVLVAIKTDDVFTYPVLKLLKDLDDRYQRIREVESTTSLVNMIDIRDSGFGIEVSKLIDKENIPKDPDELKKLRDYVLSKDLYRGKIVSKDGGTTLIICRLSQDSNKVEVAKKIKEVSEDIRGNYKIHYKIYYSGYPVEMEEMNGYLLTDLRVLIPIVIVVIIAVLFISFRTLRGVLLPLVIVVISTIWTMGVMGYTGTELSIMTNIIPVILLGLGTAYGIHFLARYYEDIKDEKTKLKDIEKSIRHIGIPILLTALTTIAGFLSFLGAYITAISEFGIFTAIGVLFAVILSLTFLPALLSLIKVKHGAISSEKSHFLKSFMKMISRFVIRNKKAIVIVTFSLFVAAVFAIPMIKTETQISNFFPKKSDIRKAEKIINRDFGGSTPIQIVVDGDIKDPQTLIKLDILSRYLKTIPHVYNPQSISDLISEMNNIVNGHKIVPATKEEVANLMFLLEGQEILNQMVNRDYTEAVVQAMLNTSDSELVHQTIKRIEEFLDYQLNGKFAVVKRSMLNQESKNWIMEDIARLISNDIFNSTGTNIDHTKILSFLKSEYNWNGFYLSQNDLEALKNELYIFFNEESEVIIDSEEDIDREVEAILNYAASSRADYEGIVKLMFNTIPERWWKDSPDAVKSSAEFVYQKVYNAQMKSYIDQIAEKLLRNILPSGQNNHELLKRISDDLYYITYSRFAVPEKYQNSPESTIIIVKSTLSGMIKIIERLDISLIKSQIQSIIIAIIAVFIILSVQFKSIKIGLIVLSPIVFVILLNFSIMGYTGIPLDYATMLVGSILIGVGIDYSIHFSSRFKRELSLSNNDERNLENTLTTTGVAIMINALMVALGFLVLIAGRLSILRREGWMIFVLMIISAFAAIVYLPSIFILLKNKLNILNGGKK